VPPADHMGATLVLGTAAECASTAWNPPGAPRPRCDRRGSRLTCH